VVKIIEIERLILDISTQFINIPPEKIDNKINDALERLGKFTKVDRSFLFALSSDKKKMTMTHEWCADGIEPQIEKLQNIHLKELPWLQDKLSKFEIIQVYGPGELPPEAFREKKELIQKGIQSLVVAPMIYKNELVGFLGFASSKKKGKWLEKEIDLLKISADIFVNSLIRKNTEKALQDSEEKYRLLVENVNDGVVISQKDKFIFINKKFAEMLGYTHNELIMKDYREIYTQKGVEIIKEREKHRDRGEYVPARYETIFKKKNGTIIDVEANVTIIDYKGAPATFAVISDITEKKVLEQRQRELEISLLKKQRLSTFGRFAEGIAHNIIEPLTVIMGRAQMLKSKMPELKEPDIIISHGLKIEVIVDNLMKKSKSEQKSGKVPIDLNELLETELGFLEADYYFKHQIEKKYYFRRGLPLVKGFYNDFSQGLLNIIQYSIDSMSESKEKKLIVKTRSDAEYIYIDISDTGCGIAKEDLPKVFTLFYHSKKYSTDEKFDKIRVSFTSLFDTYMFLKPYGVKFDVESELGVGTTFHVKMPISSNT